MIDRSAIDWWYDHYSFTKKEAAGADYSPLFSDRLNTLPRTIILTAEYECFRSDSEAFYSAIKKAGVNVDKVLMPKQTHNTLILRNVMYEGIDPAIVMLESLGIKPA